MTVEKFKEIMECNEPDFGYGGEVYSICWPDGVWPDGPYYVAASDQPEDIELIFNSLDDLLDHWMIQGKRLRDILPDIDLN